MVPVIFLMLMIKSDRRGFGFAFIWYGTVPYLLIFLEFKRLNFWIFSRKISSR